MIHWQWKWLMMPSVRHKVTSGMSSMAMVRVTLKNSSWQRLITIESPVSPCCTLCWVCCVSFFSFLLSHLHWSQWCEETVYPLFSWFASPAWRVKERRREQSREEERKERETVFICRQDEPIIKNRSQDEAYTFSDSFSRPCVLTQGDAGFFRHSNSPLSVDWLGSVLSFFSSLTLFLSLSFSLSPSLTHSFTWPLQIRLSTTSRSEI